MLCEIALTPEPPTCVATVRGHPEHTVTVQRDAFREAAGAAILGGAEGVESVALGDEAYQDIHGGRARAHERQTASDISATTATGSRLLGEAKGRSDPAKAVAQLEASMEALKRQGIRVDGYYIFKPVGTFTQPGFSVHNGILTYNDKPRKIEGKLVYVIEIEPSGDQLRAFGEEG